MHRAILAAASLLVMRPAACQGLEEMRPPPRLDSAASSRSSSPTPLLRCAEPTGELIHAEEILRDLREGKDVTLRGRVIAGDIDLDRACPLADERRISQRIVRGRLALDSCRID